ncbi:MAG: undecaprenyl-diphosphate phosphatase [Candidatus Omnitrophica bacterium]|nr:undecaprenyl-diphosphate phosphatase [Candidatus Omnitrophota bacterium]
MVTIYQILLLAVIQGACELLPVSSSAHVILAEKLMGLDPTSPQMTFLLVMLHTGTMLAVIVFFWNSWKSNFFPSRPIGIETAKFLAMATVGTGLVALFLKVFIEKVILRKVEHAQVELLFGNLLWISIALAAAGLLIIWAGYKEYQDKTKGSLTLKQAGIIGIIQGFCLPFRGFSRSGATISTGLILGVEKKQVEDFSFALAVILTPPVLLREMLRLLKAEHVSMHHGKDIAGLFLPGLLGMVLSFVSGLVALQWLSYWLEKGRWYWFGIYCLLASSIAFLFYTLGL